MEDPFSNLALEEALFRSLKEPTLRLWDNQKSVVIGRGQLARLETDVSLCEERGIPVVRRFTAGGAVYNGPGNINWSFFQPRTKGDGAGGVFDAGSVFRHFADKVVRALVACSVECFFESPNRIMNSVGKISGMAAYMSSEAVVCHGTLLTNANLEEAGELTNPPIAEADRRYARSKPVRMSNCGVSRSDFATSLAKVAMLDGDTDRLRREEQEFARRLVDDRYSKATWNLGDPFQLYDL
jgi:lipoate---protein ligase